MTTEILLAQQLHTAAYGVHRLHYLIIEYYQIDKDKPDEPLQYVQIQRRLSTQQIYQHSTQTEQKKDKYEEKNFMRTGLEYYIFPNVCKAARLMPNDTAT